MISSSDSRNKTIKAFPVSIAYRLKKNENNVFSLDSSLVGKVCLFFPTEMDSLLHFHINGPFVSTVARDVILSAGEDGETNTKLIRKLADLTAESLHWLKKAKMLDYAAYSTLPSLRDYNNQPDSRYKIFASRIKEEFENNELFIADNGNYYAIKDVFKAANKDIKSILPTKFVEKIYHKSWIPTVPSVTRVEYFIDQFKITEYSIEDFIDSLNKNSNCFDELFSEQNNVEYFKTLYYLFSQSKERIGYASFDSPSRNEILGDVKFILCEDKKLHSAKDNIYLRTYYQPKHYFKNPIYVDLSLKNTDTDRRIRQFLLDVGVKEMCERVDLLANVSGDNVYIDDMVHKMVEIIDRYKSGAINIKEYKDSQIFIAVGGDGKFFKAKANECCWDESSAFFYKTTKYTLAQECYQQAGNGLSTQLLKEVFTKLGGEMYPIFVKSYLDDSHPQFKNTIKNGVERETMIREDYIIDDFYDFKELDLIKEKNLKEVSLILWKQVLKENDKHKLQAVYRANRSVEPQYMDSSLVYYLNRTAWIPTKSGTYKCPYELTDEDLLDDFKYEKPSLLLSAISEKPNDIVEQLKRAGIEEENTFFLRKMQ